MLPVSVFIITQNEADRIGDTIRAIQNMTDDIIVIDSGSSDETQSLAKELGARVIEHAWSGFGMQKRFGEDQCRYDWLLNLDADEVMPPDLLEEIKTLFALGAPQHKAYTVRIAEIFPGEEKPHPWAYTLSPVRLYRRDAGRYSPSPVHDRVQLYEGVSVGHLKGIIHHRSIRSLGDQIYKLNRYSDQQVEELEERGVKLPVWRVFLEFPAAFLKAYFGRRHFVRGVYGYTTAMNYAISRYLRIAKHYEKRRLTLLKEKKQKINP